MKIAVFIHIHDFDVVPNLVEHIMNIPHSFDLFVNFSFIYEKNEKNVEQIKKYFSKQKKIKNTYYSVSNNRGQDCGGFFKSIEIIREKKISYDIACKVHTKRNEDVFINAFGGVTRTIWRDELYKRLLGNPQAIKNIINLFKNNSSIGFFSHKRYWVNYFEKEQNETNYYILKKKLGLPNSVCWPEEPNFLGGTMFWISGTVLDFFVNCPLTVYDFELGAASDGSVAHAFERIIPACVMQTGSNIFCQ